MIELTKIDGRKIIINAEEIESIESTYDSMICLKSGKKIIVRESPEEIMEKVVEYKKKIFGNTDGFRQISNPEIE